MPRRLPATRTSNSTLRGGENGPERLEIAEYFETYMSRKVTKEITENRILQASPIERQSAVYTDE